MNGQYIAAMSTADFIREARPFFAAFDWAVGASEAKFEAVAALMQTRTRDFTQIESWKYFFSDELEYGGKQFRKQFKQEENRNALAALSRIFGKMTDELTPETALEAIAAAENQAGLEPGRLFPATRLATTGAAGSAELDATLTLIGAKPCSKRIEKALQSYLEQAENPE
jgi:glutamyl/glutaminyl-tRNA synthetase